MPVVKRTLNFYWSQLTNGTHYVHITTRIKQQLLSFQQVIFSLTITEGVITGND